MVWGSICTHTCISFFRLLKIIERLFPKKCNNSKIISKWLIECFNQLFVCMRKMRNYRKSRKIHFSLSHDKITRKHKHINSCSVFGLILHHNTEANQIFSMGIINQIKPFKSQTKANLSYLIWFSVTPKSTNTHRFSLFKCLIFSRFFT